MPIYRGPDGKIIEEQTNKREGRTRSKHPYPLAPTGGDQAVGRERLDAPTQKMDTFRSPSQELGDTQIVGARPQRQDEERLKEYADGPVVGWLIVVKGPGEGRSVELGYGHNTIGRGTNQRVQLNFGDDKISRHNHATVTCDPFSKKFHVLRGSSLNMTHLLLDLDGEPEPVLESVELLAYNHILIGDTILRFVPLCGDAFDWQNMEEYDDSGPSQPSPTRVRDQDTKDCDDADSLGNTTPLHVAALNNNRRVAERLLELGYDANAKNNYGETPLDLAKLYKANDTAEVLLRYGARETK